MTPAHDHRVVLLRVSLDEVAAQPAEAEDRAERRRRDDLDGRRADARRAITGRATGSSTCAQDLALPHAHAAGRLDEVAVDAADARVGVDQDRRDRPGHHRDERRVDLEAELGSSAGVNGRTIAITARDGRARPRLARLTASRRPGRCGRSTGPSGRAMAAAMRRATAEIARCSPSRIGMPSGPLPVRRIGEPPADRRRAAPSAWFAEPCTGARTASSFGCSLSPRRQPTLEPDEREVDGNGSRIEGPARPGGSRSGSSAGSPRR